MSHAAPRPRQQTHSNHPLKSAEQRQKVRATLSEGHHLGTLNTICEGFKGGYLGQTFSRNPDADEIEFLSLDDAETDLLLSLIARTGHDATLFVDDDRRVVGCWLCDCEKCESAVLDFVRCTKISLLAEAERARSYKFVGGNDVDINVIQHGLPTSWPPRQAFQVNWKA